ncbi:hypothetical protein ADIARSV_2378 [Arcticibacter svalbardensis MN12-7]|uniref:Uncharacterized protein n=1 Tax=Arcticibacter svalbardensis MN12-7 TaxID=1150600 RepID=R9GRQ6_9SPHI|nr:hypothetical protein [Arcticibacter svalbardensis]EOR94532.1 hypothetical protein ADIARSV_2378 [Arcticibacter svalbardensis MN12-7]
MVATALAFIVGHVNVLLYIPLWFLNALLMAFMTSKLIGKVDRTLRTSTWLLILPWIFIAIFGGMGPPPETAIKWAALSNEQIARYTILIISGLLVYKGFYYLHNYLKNKEGDKYSRIGLLLISLGIPFFIINMVYWGYFLTYIFATYTAPESTTKPEWVKLLGEAFTLIRMIEVALIYLSTAAFALALRVSRILSKGSCIAYVTVACLCSLFNFLPGSVPAPLNVINYLSYIPAFTLLMPYLIAINILRKQKP